MRPLFICTFEGLSPMLTCMCNENIHVHVHECQYIAPFTSFWNEQELCIKFQVTLSEIFY